MENDNNLIPPETIVEKLKKIPLFNYTIGMIPTSYKESLTYEEQLLWFCHFLQEVVIPAVNNNGNAVIELQELYKDLINYVNNYFTNLNVQEQINNKLDDMVEDGTMAEIINQEIFGELNQAISDLSESTTSSFEEVNSSIEGLTEDLQTLSDNTEGSIDDINTSISGIEGDILNIETDINNIRNNQNPISFYKNKNLVVFGDSFTDPQNLNSVNGHWVTRVCEATGMIPFNFAKGASSFMRPANSFRMQVQNALLMTEEQKTNTSVIIFYAPDTDVIENIDLNDYYTEVDDLIQICVENFPNAKIIFAGFTWRVNYLTDEYNNKMNSMLFNLSRNESKYPVVFLKNCRFWLLGLTGYYQNQYHPNENGYNVIAQYFVNAIYGGTNDSYRDTDIIPLSLPNLSSDNYCEFEQINGQVSIKMFLAFNQNVSSYEARFRIPTFAVPDHDIMIPFLDVNSNIVGSFRLTSGNDGEGIVKISSLNQDVNAFLAPNSFRACACRDF